jgi:hypothetical protein
MKSPEDRMREAGGTTRIYRPNGTGHANPNGNGRVINQHEDTHSAPLECIRLEPIGAAKICPRTWAYGHFLLFGNAAVIGAVDGAGKGAIAVVMAIAQITRKPLLGERIWRSGPVAIVTYEDDETEWHRRIAAACRHHDVDYAEVMANVYFLRRPGGRVVFADRTATGRTMFPDGDAIIDHLRAIKAVLLIVDPFNNAHAMDDGNSNVLIARVAEEITRIARQAGVAALVLHHLRKGSNGGLDDLMGAVALRANFRSCRILARMTAEEANKLNISDGWRYVRVAGTKANYAPPPDRATWFRLVSTSLYNPAGIYTDGDEVGVAEIWQPRAMFNGIEAGALRAVFDSLRQTPHARDKRARYAPWAGTPLKTIASRTDPEAQKIISAWIESGLLTEGQFYHEASKRSVSKLELNETKAAHALAGIELPGHGE